MEKDHQFLLSKIHFMVGHVKMSMLHVCMSVGGLANRKLCHSHHVHPQAAVICSDTNISLMFRNFTMSFESCRNQEHVEMYMKTN